MSKARELAELGAAYDSGALSNRNLIINGGMTISQRIGTTATAITGGSYGLDRWLAYYDGNSYTTQQVADAPASSGLYNSMKLLVTGTSTPNYSFFGQKLEANNINHIGLGTANCQSFTISFYVKSSVTGVYSISVTNNASNLAYPVQYTINSADTWERKTMTIPAITSGTWEVGTGIGIFLRFNMGSPSSRTDTADGWRTGNFDGADGSTGSIAWATTSGASFYITGCQLEVGTEATPFEHRSFGDELHRCQRYFEVIVSGDSREIGGGNYYSSSSIHCPTIFETSKRTNSYSITVTGGTNYFRVYRNGTSDDFDNFAGSTRANINRCLLYATSGVSGTAGHGLELLTNNASAKVVVDDEL